MKIIAKPNSIDPDMIELYSESSLLTGKEGNVKKFLMGAVHVDNFQSPIYERLNEGKEVFLSLELAGE